MFLFTVTTAIEKLLQYTATHLFDFFQILKVYYCKGDRFTLKFRLHKTATQNQRLTTVGKKVVINLY